MVGTSLRARLGTAMALLLALVLVLAAVAVATLARVEGRTQDTLVELATIGDLTAAMTEVVHSQVREAEVRLATAAPGRDRALAALGDSAHALRRTLLRWSGFTTRDRQLLATIERWQSRAEVEWATAHALADLGRGNEAAQALAAARATTDSLLARVRDLQSAQREGTFARAAELRREVATRRNVLWFLAFLAAIVAVASTGLALRALNRPMARLVAATQRFGQGDLRAADLSGMPAELAALGGAMNLMRARLRQLTAAIHGEAREVGLNASDLSAMSEELAASSGEIAAAMLRLTEGTTGQLATLQQADQQLDRLRAAGIDTLQAARRVVTVGQSLAAVASDQQRHVREAATALLSLRETVRRATAEVREAARQSEGLQVLVEGERQLATKVAVLAVNSAIEAARVGDEAGGIHAVTAELRLLESLCETAARQAEEAVDQVRATVRATAGTLEAGGTIVLGIEAVAGRAAAALEEIGQGLDGMRAEAEHVVANAEATRGEITAMLARTEAISLSATEQSTTGESVSAASEEQAAATEELAAAAARLGDAAGRLEALVAEFRV